MGLVQKGMNSLASRQKNCNECVQAKRRCDRRTPICSRCIKKNIPCIYTKSKSSRKLASQETGQSSATASPLNQDTIDPLLTSHQLPELPDLGHLEPPSTDVTPYPAITTAFESISIPNLTMCDVGADAMALFTNWMDSASMLPEHQWLEPLDQIEAIDSLSRSSDKRNMIAYEKMGSFCDHIDSWHLHDSKSPLHYVVGRVIGFVSELADRNAAPFLHRYLYRHDVPQCILSCFSASVLYAKRTPENTAMVMRALHNHVRELFHAENDLLMTTPAHKLARTQALFIYQIIRLFDGDVFLRAQGEKDMSVFRTWLSELCDVRDNLSDTTEFQHANLGKEAPEDWESWIFSESLRRTVVMAYSVLGLYEFMKDPESEDGAEPWSYDHRWTLSRHLWESDSGTEFNNMWKEKPRFVITNYTFDEFLEYGSGEDVDDFAALLLTTYIGMDNTKELLSSNATKSGPHLDSPS